MVVQCELCATRFKLDDSKVKDQGVRVRCSKCRHIFVVMKERVESSDETDFDSFLDGLVAGNTSASGGTEAVLPDKTESSAEEIASEPDDKDEPVYPVSGVDDSDLQSFSFLREEPQQNPIEQESTPFDDFTELESNETSLADGSQKEFIEQPYENINLETNAYEFDSGRESGLDNSSQFNKDVTTTADIGVAEKDDVWTIPEKVDFIPVEEDLKETVLQDDTGISWDTNITDYQAKVKQPDNGSLVEPLPEFHLLPVSASDNSLEVNEDISAGDAPPAMPNDRKRPVSKLLISLAVISLVSIIALAGAGLYALDKGPAFLEKLGIGELAKWAGLESVEQGGISIRNAASEFVVNKIDGELFVIKGEALNSFSKPKGSIQLKATLYNPKGIALVSKNVYCGNALNQDQLTSLPIAKLENIMGNQFGDSLSNIGLPPGRAIPFVVVFSGVPKDAVEFGLEIIGTSKVSAEK